MELALAIVTALGGLFAIIKMVMMRRDKKSEERKEAADEAGKLYDKGEANSDQSSIALADARIKRLRKKK